MFHFELIFYNKRNLEEENELEPKRQPRQQQAANAAEPAAACFHAAADVHAPDALANAHGSKPGRHDECLLPAANATHGQCRRPDDQPSSHDDASNGLPSDAYEPQHGCSRWGSQPKPDAQPATRWPATWRCSNEYAQTLECPLDAGRSPSLGSGASHGSTEQSLEWAKVLSDR